MQAATIGIVVDFRKNKDFVFRTKTYSELEERIENLKSKIERVKKIEEDSSAIEDDESLLFDSSKNLESLLLQMEKDYELESLEVYIPFLDKGKPEARLLLSKIKEFIRNTKDVVLTDAIAKANVNDKELLALQVVLDPENFHFLSNEYSNGFAFYFPLFQEETIFPDSDESLVNIMMKEKQLIVDRLVKHLQESFDDHDKAYSLRFFLTDISKDREYEIECSSKLVLHQDKLPDFITV